MSKRIRAAIVGGGISGLSAAHALIRRGIDVTVYEQAPALGEIGAGVFTYPNALRPLARTGLGEAFAKVGAKVGPGSEYYRMDGTLVGKVLTTDSAGWNGMYGMHRADLLNIFTSVLPPSAIRAGHRCIGFEQDAGAAYVNFDNGNTEEADVVIACDGIHSTLQKFVVEPSPPEYSGSRAYRGLIEANKLPKLAQGSAPDLDGRGEALHGVPGPPRRAFQLCRLRPDEHRDGRVMVGDRRPQ